jgi:PPK2 family polyphosphate:nucleotide phosphotransferase
VTAQELIKEAHHLAERYRVTDGAKFRLKNFDPGDTAGLHVIVAASAAVRLGLASLSALQEKLYADDRWSALLIFQAMDAAGKDSAIKHVMSGVDPQGCQVFSFKTPTSLELDHDFLWRTAICLPERGRIGIFNRSYYEEVLIVRVHPELLDHQKLPSKLRTKNIWEERFEDIRAFEKHLARSGTIVRKFFLNVSRKEQKRRFLKRLEHAEKNWKFATADVAERGHWDEYLDAYEQAIRHTATPEAPWYVIPADHKWFTRLIVAAAAIDALASLNLEFPEVDKTRLAELAQARKDLLATD